MMGTPKKDLLTKGVSTIEDMNHLGSLLVGECTWKGVRHVGKRINFCDGTAVKKTRGAE